MFAQLVKLFTPSSEEVQAANLYARIVEQARSPVFYTDYGVPDTLDGRFDMILLHLFLIIHRLKQESESHYHNIAQALVDTMMNDMDRSLREMGVADTGVGKRIKRMADAQHGRLTAYGDALKNKPMLKEALARNLYGTVNSPDDAVLDRLIDYIQQNTHHLHTQKAEDIALSKLTFAAIN